MLLTAKIIHGETLVPGLGTQDTEPGAQTNRKIDLTSACPESRTKLKILLPENVLHNHLNLGMKEVAQDVVIQHLQP